MSRLYKANKEVTTIKGGYKLEVIRLKDVLDELPINDSDDIEIYKSIITQLESKSAQALVQCKTIALPYIGRLRKPLVKKEYSKNIKLLQFARKRMSREDYKEYKKDVYKECVEKVENDTRLDKLRRRLIALNRKKYNKKYTLFGENYANTWIESLLWLTPIEFNQEVQDVFDEIEENENRNRKANYRR